MTTTAPCIIRIGARDDRLRDAGFLGIVRIAGTGYTGRRCHQRRDQFLVLVPDDVVEAVVPEVGDIANRRLGIVLQVFEQVEATITTS